MRIEEYKQGNFEVLLCDIPNALYTINKLIDNKLYESIMQKSEGYVSESARNGHICGRVLLAYWLQSNRLPYNITEDLLYTPFGKPYINGLDYHFNISHAGSMAALAVSKTAIGIDVEEVKPIDYHAFRPCFEREWPSIAGAQNPLLEFFKCWTQKESVIKADGRGLSIALSDVRLHGSQAVVADAGQPYASTWLPAKASHVVCVSWPC